MRRPWLAVAVWDLFLVGVPLMIAAVLAFNNWPLANDRLLLGYGPGLGPTSVSVSGPQSQPTYDEFKAAVDQKRAGVGCPPGSIRSRSVPGSDCW